jgi:protease-4
VLGGKLVTREFWGLVGITWDEVHSSENAEMWSPRHDYDTEGFARFQAGLDRVYEDFTGKVAQGRELPLERVQQVARGRIWTGEDALELGLVDDLGGYDVALAAIREELGLAPDAPLRIKELPPRRTPLEQVLELYTTRQHAPEALIARSLRSLQPTFRLLRQLGLTEPTGVLSLPEPLASSPTP